MGKIWNSIKKYLGVIASPITLYIILVVGVIIAICGFIFGFGVLYDEVAGIFSAVSLILILPLVVVLCIFAFFINPITSLIQRIKNRKKK